MKKIKISNYVRTPKENQVGSFRVDEKVYSKLKKISKEKDIPISVLARIVVESCIDDVKFEQ